MRDSSSPTARTGTSRNSAGGLKHRHLHFIALGSAIGTGLFYGSAEAIQAAGPAVLLVYLLGGVVVYFMLRALGEMAVRNPVAGSFAEYARAHMGGWAGYITGWMFAFEMVIVCLADLTAIGIYMGFWFPDAPRWIWVAVTLLIVGAANLASVKSFGELEFGFTIIKVGAVVAMILGGAAILVFGLSDSHATGPANLTNDGGFFPHGPSGMIASFILVLFAFGGTEIIGIAGTKAEHPEESVPKAINTVPLRILLFYVVSLAIILMIIPWREVTGDASPFVQIFSTLGVSWAAAALNVVVITAALSAINADLFGASNVLQGLARQKLAPGIMAKSRNGVPVFSTLILLVVLVGGVILNALLPERVFEIVASLATFATVFVWLMILLSHVWSRKNMTREEVANLNYRVPFWPVGQIFAIAFILFTFGIMAWTEEYHLALAVGAGFVALTTLAYFVTGAKRAADSIPDATASTPEPTSGENLSR